MNRQTVFEKLLSDLSTGLAISNCGSFDAAIHKALQNTLKEICLQHLILFQYASDLQNITVLHAVYAKESAQLPPDFTLSHAFPWSHEQLQQGRVVRINSLQGLPQRAAQDAMSCQSYDIQSVLAVPLSVSGVLRYAIVATASHPMTWSRYRVERMRLLGNILASALEREKAIWGIQPSDETWRLILENIPAAIWYIDQERRYRFVNREFARLLQRPVGAIHGLYVWEALGDDDYAVVRDMIDRGLAGYCVEIQNTLHEVPDGPRRLAGALVPDISSEGNVQGCFAVLEDVTRIEELERECRQLKECLAHLDRVAKVHVMSSSLVHELSQPLFAILNNAQAAIRNLEQENVDWREIRRIFREIESDDKRASSMINRVRNLVRKKVGPEYELLNLDELILEVVHMAQNELMARKSRIEADIADNLPRIKGDRVQIQQVIINLLCNAMDAVQQCPSMDDFILVSAWRQDNSARFSVTDSGSGMDRATLTSAFKPFYSTKSHGMGLGLTVCHSIVTDHGGRIWAESPEDGRGLRAVVSLPAVAQGD